MNILESLWGAKNVVTDRVGNYSDVMMSSIRDKSGEWAGQAGEFADDTVDSVTDTVDDWRHTPMGRIGIWLGVGVAILGGALYAWKLYQDMNLGNKAGNNRIEPFKLEARNKSNGSNPLKEKVGSASQGPAQAKASAPVAKKSEASEVGSTVSKSKAASRTSSAQTPKANRVKAGSQHTAHISADAAKATEKPAGKTTSSPSTAKSNPKSTRPKSANTDAGNPRATGA